MAGLTKQELAAKAAYQASSNRDPEVEWKDLTGEEKASWLAQADAAQAKEDADTTRKELEELRAENAKLKEAQAKAAQPEPTGNQAAAATYQHTGEPMPATDPEHGDMTPAFAYWYAGNHSKEQFMEKYGTRLHLLPEEAVNRAESRHERRTAKA